MRTFLCLGFCVLTHVAMAGVAVPPSITVQPKNATVVAPVAATFTVTAKGSAPLTYQWQQSTDGGATFANIPVGAPFTGQTTRTLKVSPTNDGLSGNQFQCIIFNGTGNVTSNAVTLTVNVKPAITTQPVSQMILIGQPVTFTVTASGTQTLNYQWNKNGRPITGQTGTSFTIPSVATTDAGTYTVKVTGPGGFVTSAGAKLTPATAPAITVQPLPKGVVAPGAATFTVTATGTAPLTYQWQQSTDGGGNFTAIPAGTPFRGQTTRALIVSPTALGLNGTLFQCLVSNGVGEVTSTAVPLTVGVKPTITTQPMNLAVKQGDPATFEVEASGTMPLFYQWKKNNVAIVGQTTDTLNIPSVTGTDAASYTVTVTNSVGLITSKPAKLTVATVPSITVQPAPKGVVAPGAATFTVTATGTAPLTYQWQQSTDGGGNFTAIPAGTPFRGQTTRALTVSPTALGLNGTLFQCVVTNAVGMMTSNTALLTVGVKPTITTQPMSLAVQQGDPATFEVEASGTMPLFYQWKKNNVAIVGQTTDTLNIPSVTGTDAASYTVTVTNSVGLITSKPAKLTVATPPGITAQPANVTVTAPGSAIFRVTATGTAPISYQWQTSTNGGTDWTDLANGSGISGVTTATLTIRLNTADMSGQLFRCVITNAVGMVNSNAVTLTINIRPAIISQPLSQGMSLGGTGNLSVTTIGTNLNFQWKKNGVDLPGENNSVLGFPVVDANTAGNYTVVVSNNLATVTSRTALVIVGVGPTITTQPSNVSNWAEADFNVAATGDPTITYHWQTSTDGGATFANMTNNGTISGAATNELDIFPISAAQNGHLYRCVATNPYGSVPSDPATLTFLPLGSPPFNWTSRPSNTSLALGFTQFTAIANNGTVFVAVGGNTTSTTTVPMVQISTNGGESWLLRNISGVGLINTVAWGAEKFVVGGSNGMLLTSSNGSQWTARASNTTFNITNVSWTGAQFVAVAYNSTIISGLLTGVTLGSQDGVSWTLRAQLPSGKIPYGFANDGNARYVITGQTLSPSFVFVGSILFSTNGVNWGYVVGPGTSQPNLNTVLTSVTYGNGLFVAVGTNGIIMTSPNGQTWTQRNSTTSFTLNYVTTVGSYFLACGGSGVGAGAGVVLFSSDGITWSSLTLPSNINGLLGISWTPSTGPVVVGLNGSILTGAPNNAVTSEAVESGSKDSGNGVAVVVEDNPAVSAPQAPSLPGFGQGGADNVFVLDATLPTQIIRGQEYVTVTTVLASDATLAGVVRDTGGNPVVGVKVYAYSTFAGLPLAACAETDETGAFTLAVIAGQWRVGTTADGGVNEISVNAAAGAESPAELVVP